MEGRSNEIRPCIACNHCEDSTVAGFTVECVVNALAGQEYKYAVVPSKKPKRVLVIGGGPAGMEAARVTRLRGHEVVLCEKDDELGGQLRLAAVPPHQEPLRDLAKWFENTVNRLDVDLKLGQHWTPAPLKAMTPEVVIIATGAVPYIPRLPGCELENVITANNALDGKAKVGERVVVVGGGHIGCKTADFLSEKDKKVIVLEAEEDLAMLLYKHKGSLHRGLNELLLLRRLGEKGVRIFLDTAVEAITRGHVIVRRRGVRQRIKADTVVFCCYQPERKLSYELEGTVPIYEIGDCVEPRRLYHAIHEAFSVARKI